MNANANWQREHSGFQADTPVRQLLEKAIKCATISMRSAEADGWALSIDGESVVFSVAEAMRPSEEYVDVRDLILRCGAVLFHLKSAMQLCGCLGRVQLFPELSKMGRVAVVHCHPGADRDEHPQDEMMVAAHRARWPVGNPSTEEVLKQFEHHGGRHPVWLDVSRCMESRRRLEAVTTPVRSALNRPGAEADLSGLLDWFKPWLTLTAKAGVDGQLLMDLEVVRAQEITALALLKTKTDDSYGWLMGGEMLAQIKLQAQVMGLPVCVFANPFRRLLAREALKEVAGRKGFAQVVVGLGIGRHEQTGLTRLVGSGIAHSLVE